MSRCVFLLGATGTGKSALALALARERGWSILAMDAMQVYRGADIGTSKPTAAEQAEVPHGGIDLVELGAPFDVARYLSHAVEFLRAQSEAGRGSVIVGGTGLYFRALTRGLCEAPQGSESLRAELAALSVEQLRERLMARDPAILSTLDAANPRRLARAIAVIETTGKSLAVWQAETPPPIVTDFHAYWLQRTKPDLEKRLETRMRAMFDAGWENEVRDLVHRHGLETVRHFAGIGYREIAERLSSSSPTASAASEVEMRHRILVATRQYAKRQLTWFAREPNLQSVMLTGNPLPTAALFSHL